MIYEIKKLTLVFVYFYLIIIIFIYLFRLRLKVCNVRNLSILKHKVLQQFPELNTPIICADPKLLSTKTSEDLKFSSEKYRLGCILVCNGISQDLCISRLTIAGNKNLIYSSINEIFYLFS